MEQLGKRIVLATGTASSTITAIEQLRLALRDDFNLDVEERARQRGALNREHAAELEKLSRKVQYRDGRIEELRAAVAESTNSNIGQRARYILTVCVGLSNPSVPARTLQDFIKDFSEVECKQVTR